jgi:hypothetical protein
MELVLDILNLVLGPQTWRKMSGPAVVAGALLWGVVGTLLVILGAASLARIGPAQDALFSWAEIVLGLLLLGDLVFGMCAFRRVNREHP